MSLNLSARRWHDRREDL